jgi:hypothetical protein
MSQYRLYTSLHSSSGTVRGTRRQNNTPTNIQMATQITVCVFKFFIIIFTFYMPIPPCTSMLLITVSKTCLLTATSVDLGSDGRELAYTWDPTTIIADTQAAAA